MQSKSSCCTIQTTARRQIDTNSEWLMAHEAAKENEELASNHAEVKKTG